MKRKKLKLNGGPPAAMTVAELIELLAGVVSEASLETVQPVLHSILQEAEGFFDDPTENALAVAMYAVRGIDEYGAKAILSHIESLTDDMADMAALSPATRHLCEAVADTIGPEFNEPVMVPVERHRQR